MPVELLYHFFMQSHAVSVLLLCHFLMQVHIICTCMKDMAVHTA